MYYGEGGFSVSVQLLAWCLTHVYRCVDEVLKGAVLTCSLIILSHDGHEIAIRTRFTLDAQTGARVEVTPADYRRLPGVVSLDLGHPPWSDHRGISCRCVRNPALDTDLRGPRDIW